MGPVKVTLPGREGGGSAVRKVLSRPLEAMLGKKGDREFTDLTSPIAGIQSGALLGNGRGQTRAHASWECPSLLPFGLSPQGRFPVVPLSLLLLKLREG